MVTRIPREEWEAWKKKEGELCERQITKHTMYALFESVMQDEKWQDSVKTECPTVIRVMNSMYGSDGCETLDKLVADGILLPLEGGFHCSTWG